MKSYGLLICIATLALSACDVFSENLELLKNGPLRENYLTSVTFTSNNTYDPALARTGDSLTLSFTAPEEIETPEVTIAGIPTGEPYYDGSNWSVTLTIQPAYTTQGRIPFRISNIVSTADGKLHQDVNYTTDGSRVIFDSVLLYSVSIVSDNTHSNRYARDGNIVTVRVMSQEIIYGGDLIVGETTIVPPGPGNTLTYTFQVNGEMITGNQGIVQFTLASIRDRAGNIENNIDASTDGSEVNFDNQLTLTYDRNGATGDFDGDGIVTFDHPGATDFVHHYTDYTFSYTTPDSYVINFNFTGWNTEAHGSGTHYNAGDVFTMGTGDMTLYAQGSALGQTVNDAFIFYEERLPENSWRFKVVSDDMIFKYTWDYALEILNLASDPNYSMPSPDDLVAIGTNLYQQGTGSFPDGRYWSSEANETQATYVEFSPSGITSGSALKTQTIILRYRNTPIAPSGPSHGAEEKAPMSGAARGLPSMSDSKSKSGNISAGNKDMTSLPAPTAGPPVKSLYTMDAGSSKMAERSSSTASPSASSHP
jgi:hypothetical protein